MFELSVWVVYDHPRDYPEHWVARRQIATDGGIRITDDIILNKELWRIRDAMAQRGLTYMPRHQSDDPKIFECWI